MNEDQKWLLGSIVVAGGVYLWGKSMKPKEHQVLTGPDQPEKPSNERSRNKGLLDSRDPGRSTRKYDQSVPSLAIAKLELDRIDVLMKNATRSRSSKRSAASKPRTSKKISTETVPLIEPSVSKESSNSSINKYPPEYYKLNKKQQWKFRKKMQIPRSS